MTGDRPRSAPQPRPPGTGGWIRRLSPFLLAQRRDVAVAFGAAVVGMGVAALAPALQRVVVDDGIIDRRRPVGPWLALLAMVAVVSFGCALVRRWVGGRVSLQVQYDLRNAIFERLQRLDFAGHDKLQTGQLVSRASGDLGLLQGLLSFLPIVLGNLVMIVVAFTVMVILSPLLTLVVVVTLPILGWVSFRMRAVVFPATWHAQQQAGEVAGVVDEAVAGVRVVKGFGQEDRELAHLGAAAEELYASRSRLIGLQARYTAALQAVPTMAQVAALAFGGWLALRGELTLGTFLAFAAYLVQLVAPVRMLSILFAVGQQARAGAARILDVLDANPEVVERADAVVLPPLQGEVRFEGVRFGYTVSQPILDGFDLHVAPGEVVALVGTSGSGKSTVTALLPRFYDVSAGRVTIDGIDVRDVTLESLRRQVGVAFEEAFLFSDSIRANIAYARPDATDDEIRAAAAAAGVDRFVESLPEGYDTVVGERGLTISGGQRQRVALARAILGNPRVLVLDDATSSVDAATEEAIHATLRTMLAGRTTILVAHRRSTLRLAQRIVVLDRGRVVAEGSHEHLLATSALYRDLLSGPGLDAADDEPAPAEQSTPAGSTPEQSTPAGITPEAWPDLEEGSAGSNTIRPAASAGAGRSGRGGHGGGGGGGGGWGELSATPELLAGLARLPAANDRPEVDVAAMTAPPEGPFRVLAFVRPWRRRLGLGFALVAADAVLTLLGPFLVRWGIDHGVRTGRTGPLWTASTLFALVVAVDAVVVWAYTVLTGRTAERALYGLRLRIFSHLQRMSLDYYDRELDGRIMTRMTTDVEALSQLMQTGLIAGIVGVMTGVGVFAFLIVLSPVLALATAAVLPPLVAATVWYHRRSSRAYLRARDAIASVNANLQESLSGARVAQASAREERNVSGFRSVNREYRDARFSTQRLVSVYFPFVNALGDLGAVLVLAVGAALVADGSISAGVVIAFLLYLQQFFSPVQQLSQVFDTWQQAATSVGKIEELLGTPSGTPVAADPVTPPPLRGEVTFDDVHYAYPGARGDALAGIDLVVAPGEVVALVGETGAGKSTLVKLVARSYDPTSGRVLVDGFDLRSLDLGAYRRQLGVVPQEPFLFTGTIRDNIAYGRPDASDAEVEAAARAVGAHGFVAGLPHGYRTAVTERGRSLSAGQKQLIALARALLVDPAILLLDEATSQLDLASEAKVQRAMGVAARGRTTLLVAHRLPTAATADRIVVVDGGRIVEIGSHRELLTQRGAYAALWAAYTAGEEHPQPSGAPGASDPSASADLARHA